MESWIKLTEALAWPISTIIIVLIFKSEITKLMPYLKKLKAGPLEAEFERDVIEIKNEFDPNSQISESEIHITDEKLKNLIIIDPRSAILKSWRQLELALQRAVIQKSGSPRPDISTSFKVINALENLNILSEEERDLARELRGLRNQTAHHSYFSPTEAAASMFVEMAKKLEFKANKIADI